MLIRLSQAKDLAALCQIYNQGIRSGAATFESREREIAELQSWLESSEHYPVLVLELQGQVQGFAALSAYRSRDCYRGIAEFSIYLHSEIQGKGYGLPLLQALLQKALQLGFWKVLSRIFTFNSASRFLCQKAGFREVGVYEKHAQLNGKWLDVVIVEYLISANQSGEI
ncbi:arsinothricin resistance N-acetyltransferase ArsN1 family A [Rheinheimera faecalis]|uniref:arsinothricin resistance N-acetyltransferase ArsN1 family A n=1 Tax=Rheinheimera faecalis TaxID=2901141 RepID=UPI001E526C95|nr:arsinothricin resistance N-acetyltransferase ArsN1 family A [Rheinheimera faecalis]